METAVFFGSRGRKAAAAAFLVPVFLLAGISCGRKEPPPASTQGGVAGSPGPASGVQEEPSAPPRGYEVVVAPMFPDRSVAPAVSVKSPPGGGAEVLSAVWFVNGFERGSGLGLAPSAFRRGDRIHAAVTLRTGGIEMVRTTGDVVAGNALPAVSDVRIEPRAPVSGGTVSAVVQGQDPDDDPLNFKYQWYADNVAVRGGVSTLALTGVKRGTWIHVVVTPNDGFGDGAWRESPRYQVVNALPVVKSALPGELPPSRHFVYRIVAEDPDGDPLTYVLAKGPPGMLLTGDTLEWQIPDEYIGKPVEAVVRISDDHDGSTHQNISMTIQPPR